MVKKLSGLLDGNLMEVMGAYHLSEKSECIE